MELPIIQHVIPQRYPYLYVDKVLEITKQHRIVAIKNVSANEPIFQGMVADELTFPETAILESLFQAASLLVITSSGSPGQKVGLSAIKKSTFIRPVRAGDQLRLECEIRKTKEHVVLMACEALVEGQRVCSVDYELNLMQIPSRPQIHATATIHPSAILGKDVSVGAFSIIGEDVIIGDRTTIAAHSMIDKWTRIGEDCNIHYGCVLGSAAQDMSYQGEKTAVVIGDRNEIREYVTINRSTGKNTTTSIGSDNSLLTHVHLGHNCQLGSHIVIANGTNIAGHCEIDDRVTIGGMTGIHQFVRIGTGCMVGAYTRLPQDIPPFMLCEGNPAVIKGLNSIGLRRSGLSRDTIKELKQIFKTYYQSGNNVTQAIAELRDMVFESEQAQYLIAFISQSSKRGITRKQPSEEAVPV